VWNIGYDDPAMRDLALLFIHPIVTVARLFEPGGTQSIVAESLLVKYQLLTVNRSGARAPDLRPTNRVILGLRELDAPDPLATFSHCREALHHCHRSFGYQCITDQISWSSILRSIRIWCGACVGIP
jgi:hypothetical protein